MKHQKLVRNLDPVARRCQKIPMFPTQLQHACMLRWFRDARRTYNLAMTHVLKHHWHRNNSTPSSKMEMELQNTYMAANGLQLRPKDAYLLRTPKVIRQQAVKSVMTVLKTHATNVKKRLELRTKYPDARAFKKDIKFNPGFKARAMKHDAISIEARSFRFLTSDTCGIYSNYNFHDSFTNRMGLTGWEPKKMQKSDGRTMAVIRVANVLAADTVSSDFKIYFDGRRFTLLAELVLDRRAKLYEPLLYFKNSVVALDPGVRKFLTGYSPEGEVKIFGTNTTKVLNKLLRRIKRKKKKFMIVKKQFTREKRGVSYRKKLGHGHVKPDGTRKPWTYLRGRRYACLKLNDDRDIIKVTGRQLKKSQRNRLWRAKAYYREAEDKAKRVIRNMHYTVAHDLCRNYAQIVLPHTSSHQWRKGKRLHKSVKQRAMMLAFGQFRRRLVETATWYANELKF